MGLYVLAGGTPHAVNWVTLLAKATYPSGLSDFLYKNEMAIFSAIVVVIVAIFCIKVSNKISIVPSKTQLVLEAIVLFLDKLVTDTMGPRGRKYTPFIGSLFVFILVSNLYGLIPLQNSATAALTTTAPLAICVFLYVQFIGITQNGIKGYIFHLMGSPSDIYSWILVPINLPLHVLGEFIKPISLMFRLYGNIMAGHILVAVFLGLGIQMLSFLPIPVGVPLHFPFMFLEILVGLIQALVFTLLSTVYIAMMLPHEHEHHDEAHAAA